MIIWLINIGEEIPSDPGTPRLLRTGILAQHLADRGHEVTWWNSTMNHQRKTQRCDTTLTANTPEGYRLILLHGRSYKRNISIARIFSQIENARAFAKRAPELAQPDVILCGYPTIELAGAAVDFATGRGIPIAVDFRDMWPDIIENQVPDVAKWLTKPLFGGWYRSQRKIAEKATAIVGITDAFVDWALEKSGRSRLSTDRAFHLAINPKAPSDNEMVKADKLWDDLGVDQSSGKLIGCFAGTFSNRLDLMTIVKAAVRLSPEEQESITLVLCGRGDQDEELLRAVSGASHILVPGWRNSSEIYSLLRRSHFAILPYPSTKDFQISFPNKVGEYLSAGLPIMTGLTGQTEQLLRERDLGFFYEEGNPVSAAKCLSNILAQKDMLRHKGEPAIATFHDLFDGSHIYPAFCDYLEDLGSRNGPVDHNQ